MGRFDEAMRASEEVSASTAILEHGAGHLVHLPGQGAYARGGSDDRDSRSQVLRSAGLSGDSLWRIVEADEEP